MSISMVIPRRMKAVVYRGKNDLRCEEIPVPKIAPGELLVRVALCGICPTDIKKIQSGNVPPPKIFGHETAGTIVQCGRGVAGFESGDRVALHHHVPCGKCHWCTHRAFAQCPQYKKTGITSGFAPAGGGFAEYVRVMASVLPGVVKIPPPNTFLEGAMLEPVNTVLKAVKKIGLKANDTVLVLGQGAIGLLFSRIFSMTGVLVFAADLLKNRLLLAKKYGRASVVFNPNKVSTGAIKTLTKGRGVDAVVVTVGSQPAFQQALKWTRLGGQILLFGHTQKGSLASLDLGVICRDEIDLKGSYSSDFTLQNEVSELVFSGKLELEVLVSHYITLEQTQRGINLASNPSRHSLKVMVVADKGGCLSPFETSIRPAGTQLDRRFWKMFKKKIDTAKAL